MSLDKILNLIHERRHNLANLIMGLRLEIDNGDSTKNDMELYKHITNEIAFLDYLIDNLKA